MITYYITVFVPHIVGDDLPEGDVIENVSKMFLIYKV